MQMPTPVHVCCCRAMLPLRLASWQQSGQCQRKLSEFEFLRFAFFLKDGSLASACSAFVPKPCLGGALGRPCWVNVFAVCVSLMFAVYVSLIFAVCVGLVGPGGLSVGPGGLYLGTRRLYVAPGGLYVGPGGLCVGPGGLCVGPGGLCVGPGGLYLGPRRLYVAPGGLYVGPGGGLICCITSHPISPKAAKFVFAGLPQAPHLTSLFLYCVSCSSGAYARIVAGRSVKHLSVPAACVCANHIWQQLMVPSST